MPLMIEQRNKLRTDDMYDNEVTVSSRERDFNRPGERAAAAAMTDRKMPNVINRVQGLTDLAANVRDHASKIGDTLLGSHPTGDSEKSPIEGRKKASPACRGYKDRTHEERRYIAGIGLTERSTQTARIFATITVSRRSPNMTGSP